MELDVIRRVVEEMRFKIEREMPNTELDVENYIVIVESLQKQIPKIAQFEHSKGDRMALITCPMCSRSIISNLEKYKEFNEGWYCKECGQLLTLEEN